MDGNLQHSPAEIPKFTEKLEQGYDVVCGWRVHHTDGSWLQKASTACANWITAKISGTAIHDFGGGFKAYKRELVAQLSIYGELQRLIPVMALRQGEKYVKCLSPFFPGNMAFRNTAWAEVAVPF